MRPLVETGPIDYLVVEFPAGKADFSGAMAEKVGENVGHIAAALVWENTWAAPFTASIRRSGGQLVASGRIPPQAIIAAAEASADAALTERA